MIINVRTIDRDFHSHDKVKRYEYDKDFLTVWERVKFVYPITNISSFNILED